MRVELERRQVLYDYGAPIDRIFFPETLVASEVRLLQEHSEPDPLAGLRMQEDGLSTLTSPEHSARNGDS